MQVALHNKVKIYNLTAGKSLPEWLAEKKKNRAAAGETRIELIHDLEFPHFTKTLFRTKNGSYLFAAGDYPPRLKCYDVNHMSMKYSFNADMSINSGVSLSPDFRKFALRGEGRVITIHHSAVIIDRLRVPHAQRGLTFHEHSCELLSPGSSHEIFRINLDTGAFVESYKTASHKGVNHVDTFDRSGLVVAACENGVVEAFDARSGKAAAQLVVSERTANAAAFASEIDAGQAVTHVSVDNIGGLQMCAGTSGGVVALYDIRSSKPLLVKDHMNSLPIVKTYFYQSGGVGGRGRSTIDAGDGVNAGGRSTAGIATNHIVSADTSAVKIWNKADGSNFTTVEAPATIYDFEFIKVEHNMAAPYQCADSGVLCICCDTPKVQVHFVPQLGVAPSWSSFLDSITEELEEKESTVVYDDFRFVTKEEFQKLGLSGDELADGKVRPYMHGFFVENKLYRELMAVVDPAGFNKFAEQNRKAKRQEKKDDRISTFRRVKPGENVEDQIDITDDLNEAQKTDGDVFAAARADPRFAGKLDSDAFKKGATKGPRDSATEYAKLVKNVEALRAKAGERHRVYESSQFNIVPDTEGDQNSGDDDDDDDADLPASMRKKKPETVGARTTTMYAAKPGVDVAQSDKQIHHERRREKERKLTLAEQVARRTHGKRGRH